MPDIQQQITTRSDQCSSSFFVDFIVYLLVALVLMVPSKVFSETSVPSNYVPAPVVSTENLLQMIGSLLLVLAIIWVIAWLLKRYALIPTSASNGIKIIATVGVGQRERVVIVEVEGARLVLGVAPGRVNTLHRINITPDNKTPETNAEKFSGQLSRSIERNHE